MTTTQELILKNHRVVSTLSLLAVLVPVIGFTACGGGSFVVAHPTSTPVSTPGASSGSGGGSSNTGGGGGGSTPTSGMTTLGNLQNGNWLTCGNCGNTGATGAVAGQSFQTGIGNPSESGASALFSVMPTAPYSNAYFWEEHGAIAGGMGALVYQFDFYIPAGSENLPQALEFECQQQLGGWIYNFAWQADYGSHQWRIFDYGTSQWQAAGISVQNFAPGTWHHVVAEFHNDTATHKVYHDALTIDGTRYAVGAVHDAVNRGVADKFTNAFQLDSNSQATPYGVYVDAMQVSYR
jgi:hypothetical protein